MGNREAGSAKNKFSYIDKWLSNTQITQKLSNYFWRNEKIPDTQITQALKFRYAQYMGNHREKHIMASHTPKPQLYTMP